MLSVGTGDLLLLAPAQGSPLAVTRLRLGNAGSWPRVQTPLGAGVAGVGAGGPRQHGSLQERRTLSTEERLGTPSAGLRVPLGRFGHHGCPCEEAAGTSGTARGDGAGDQHLRSRRATEQGSQTRRPFSAVLPPPRGSAERPPGLGRARGPRPRAGPAPAASADAALAGGHRGPPPSGTCEEGVRPSLHAREHSLHKLHLFAPEHSPAAPAAPARTPR